MNGRSGLLATYREEQTRRGVRGWGRGRWFMGFVIVAAIAIAIVLIVVYTGGGGSGGGGGY
jgi:small-conductance mechanosensitive channel